MDTSNPATSRLIEDVASRHGVSTEAVRVLLQAVAAGGGTMAQFSHPELGGMGQWSRGG
ncbi:MAG TPA: SHOCT domain-containing protein, partial [Ancylobacter sp.]